MLLEFEIGGLPAELELTRHGERRLTVAGRRLFRAKAWQRARWLACVGEHSAAVTSQFWPWPRHSVVVDGVPHPSARALSGLSRLPVWVALFLWAISNPSAPWDLAAALDALHKGPAQGAATWIVGSFTGVEDLSPRAPGPTTASWLRVYAWLFDRDREALMAAARLYLLNHQPEEADRLVVAALDLEGPTALDSWLAWERVQLYASSNWEGACGAADALLLREPGVLHHMWDWPGTTLGRRLGFCHREPFGLRSFESAEGVPRDELIGRLRSALWNDQTDLAVELARRAGGCPGWPRNASHALRAAAFARAGLAEEEATALDALLCQRPCSERLLRNDPLTAPLLDDPTVLARVRTACSRPVLPPYPALEVGPLPGDSPVDSRQSEGHP